MTKRKPKIKKRHALTVAQKACIEIKGFEALYQTLERKMTLNGYPNLYCRADRYIFGLKCFMGENTSC